MSRYALLVLAACTGQSGTLQVSLVTAPGSHVLDPAQQLKLVVTNPHHVVMADRGSNGFSLSIDLPADGTIGALIVDAYDASGTLIATGASPPFASGGIDASVAVYMAAPNTVAEAPVALPAARSGVGTGQLSYGALFAGGSDASGATDFIAIYNSFDHTLIAGKALPAPRANLVVGVGANGGVYLFGGTDATGATADNLWRFDTTIAPSGAYTDYGDKPGFARAGQLALPTGNDDFLVTGMPAATLAGFQGALATITDVPALPAAGASVLASDGVTTVIFTGAGGVVRYRASAFDMPAVLGAPGAGSTAVAVPGGKVVLACGSADGVRVDAASAAVDPLPGVPGVAKTGCAIAATSRHVVIAGGTLAGGAVDSAVAIYDAATLAPIATSALVVPRTGAVAIALPNDQILIAGGLDGTGAPIATLELFTPESLE